MNLKLMVYLFWIFLLVMALVNQKNYIENLELIKITVYKRDINRNCILKIKAARTINNDVLTKYPIFVSLKELLKMKLQQKLE